VSAETIVDPTLTTLACGAVSLGKRCIDALRTISKATVLRFHSRHTPGQVQLEPRFNCRPPRTVTLAFGLDSHAQTRNTARVLEAQRIPLKADQFRIQPAQA